jgi:APA family basic amino acid/polyamine antiporter
MDTQLKKKYGLFTAISMVVGNVIGSGVFFKAEKILGVTAGTCRLAFRLDHRRRDHDDLLLRVCCYATKFEYVNGVVDYSEVTVGKKYAI